MTIFSSTTKSVSNPTLPSEIELVVHLKLLSAFTQHEQDIRVKASEGLFGITEIITDPDSSEPVVLAEGQKLYDYQWFIYCTRAQERFSKWWIYLKAKYGDDNSNSVDWLNNSTLPISNFILPPVDILMVWHAFLLNPRDYLTDCIRAGNRRLWSMKFPWNLVDNFITQELRYEPSQEHADFWFKETSIPWNNIDDLNEAKRRCRSCFSLITVPISGSGEFHTSSWHTGKGEIPIMGSCLVNPSMLQVTCYNCETSNSATDFAIARLLYDILMTSLSPGTPLLGSYLKHDGTPLKHISDVNYLFISTCSELKALKHIPPYEQDLRDHVIQALRNRQEMQYQGASRSTQRRNRRHRNKYFRVSVRMRRMAINKVLSSYLDNLNSGEFSLSLAYAVIRQSSFAEKMFRFRWLTYPNVTNLMNWSIQKYSRFLALINSLPTPGFSKIRGISGRMRVPTLEVDLAWHTHQMSSKNYYLYTVAVSKQFIDHDDKVEQTKLDDAFLKTGEDYFAAYGELYSRCLCEYCYTSMLQSKSSVVSVKGKRYKMKLLFSRDRAKPVCFEDPVGVSEEMRYGSHISAHNAVYLPAYDSKRENRYSPKNEWEAGVYPYAYYYYPVPISYYPSCDSSGGSTPDDDTSRCAACFGLPVGVCGGGLAGSCYGACGYTGGSGGALGGPTATGDGGGLSCGGGGCSSGGGGCSSGGDGGCGGGGCGGGGS